MLNKSRPHNWHIERNVPIAIVTGILLQLCVVVWIGSKYDSNITANTMRITRLELREQETAIPLRQISDRLSRIEGRLEQMTLQANSPATQPYTK